MGRSRRPLNELKEKLLKVEQWRDSQEITSKVRNAINTSFFELPRPAYSLEEYNEKKETVYQHLYSSYYGGNDSAYGLMA